MSWHHWQEFCGLPISSLTRVDTKEELKRLCRAVTELVRRCPLLKEFDYAGNSFPKSLYLQGGTKQVYSFQEKSQYPYLQEAFQMLEERRKRRDSSLRLTKVGERDEPSTHDTEGAKRAWKTFRNLPVFT